MIAILSLKNYCSLPSQCSVYDIYGNVDNKFQDKKSSHVCPHGFIQPEQVIFNMTLSMKPRLHRVLQTFVSKFCVEEVYRQLLVTEKILVGSCNFCRQHKKMITIVTSFVKLSSMEDVLAAADCIILLQLGLYPGFLSHFTPS